MGNKKQIKIRYTLLKENEVIGTSPTMNGIAELLGIHSTHITKQLTRNNSTSFKFRKITYEIIDKLA